MKTLSEIKYGYELQQNVTEFDEFHAQFQPKIIPMSEADRMTFNRERELRWAEERRKERIIMENKFGDTSNKDWENI